MNLIEVAERSTSSGGSNAVYWSAEGGPDALPMPDKSQEGVKNVIRHRAYDTSGAFLVVQVYPLLHLEAPSSASLGGRHGAVLLSEFGRPAGARELEGLELLEFDWNSHGAEPPNATALRNLKSILTVLMEMESGPEFSRVVPSAEGGAAVCFLKNERYADIECLNDGDILAVTSDRKGSPNVWELTSNPRAIRQTIEKIQDFLSD